jgi:hypothetical protein
LNLNSKIAGSIVLALSMLVTIGCGSTKVYESSKTLVVRGTIYNVTDVKVFSSKTEATLTNDSVIDVRDYEKKPFNLLLEQNGGSVFVRQSIDMDEQEVVYRARPVDSWSDFRKMRNKFDDATEDLQDFLGRPKESQLELD